ncbi:MAG: MarR family transcriptional regulator [Alphaproteobacteria bacterium]|nr:MarR family transcriptional regulator [Alphaproteobacteria bacterium]
MMPQYLETIGLIGRLHKLFLELVNDELAAMNAHDLTNAQGLILYYLEGEQLTATDVMHRGYYLGSNVTYNLRKLADNGYIDIEKADHDRRCIRIQLTERGQEVARNLEAAFARHADGLRDMTLTPGELDASVRHWRQLERFWSTLRPAEVPDQAAPRQRSRAA